MRHATVITSIRDDFLGIFEGVRNFNLVRIGLHLQNDFFFFFVFWKGLRLGLPVLVSNMDGILIGVVITDVKSCLWGEI